MSGIPHSSKQGPPHYSAGSRFTPSGPLIRGM